jgi:L-amino acid N-acyltransferase YncA
MTAEDATDVIRIYAAGIATGHATFEAQPPDWPTWDASHLGDCRLAIECEGSFAGWAALAATSSRPVYRGVAEHSIYIDTNFRARGAGDRLMAELVAQSEAGGFWTLRAGIFPENAASVALHARHGFDVLGTRKRIGLMSYGPMAGQWRDVLVMERRSAVVGV